MDINEQAYLYLVYKMIYKPVCFRCGHKKSLQIPNE